MEESTVERAEFIEAMRFVACSVAVVTTNGPAGQNGATVSAFCSVSADPPTVLVCLNGTSRTAKLVSENGNFNLNILPQGAENIANTFAGAFDKNKADKLTDVEMDAFDLPAIKGATTATCQVKETITSGSHHIFIGSVIAITGAIKSPLTYLNGSYHTVVPASKLDPER